jgi:hypothetical protein
MLHHFYYIAISDNLNFHLHMIIEYGGLLNIIMHKW